MCDGLSYGAIWISNYPTIQKDSKKTNVLLT